MKYTDRPIQMTRFKRPVEVEPLKSRAYSKEEIDFTFSYDVGNEERIVELSLTRAEAVEIAEQIAEFINDPWSDDNE